MNPSQNRKSSDIIKHLTIAVVGKGGTGKTTFAYLLSKQLISHQIKPLLIDADPTMSHLVRVLGISPTITIETIRTRLIQTASKGNQEEKAILAKNLDNIVEQCLIDNDKYSLIVMGQPERAGCFCPSNSLLRSIIESISTRFPIVLIDCEAGLEQIHRNVISQVDYLIILSDPSIRSIETAEKILGSANKFTHYHQVGIVLNRVKEHQQDLLVQKVQSLNIALLGVIPDDLDLSNLEISGQSFDKLPPNCGCIQAVEKIAQKILQSL